MLIEVRKAGFVNKGAQLMLLAIQQQVLQRYPEARLAMAPSRNSGSQPLHRLREHGILAKSALWRSGIHWGDLAACLPHSIRRSLGLVLDREIDGVLDAAGFAYGNPWPDRNLAELANAAQRWQQRGTALVLLPQAFGRFDSRAAQDDIRSIADAAALIYARDDQSLKHLRETVGNRASLRLAPDFTSLLKGRLPEAPLASQLGMSIAIVPNARMLDKTDSAVRDRYLPFLKHCITTLHARGLRVVLIVHGGQEDRALAEQLHHSHPDCLLITESDPLRLKGLLGACRGSIGSRYHGLISCLSQGVPAFGTSWSHKYQALYADYDFTPGLVESLSPDVADEIALCLADDHWMSTTRQRLFIAADRQKRATENMWREVFSVIDNAVQRRAAR